MHHPKADKDQLYLLRTEGGRSLIETELTYKTTTIGLHRYLQTIKVCMMELIRNTKTTKNFTPLPKKVESI